MELSKGIDTKAKFDGQRACEIFVRSNSMGSGDDRAKEGTQLSLIVEGHINKE